MPVQSFQSFTPQIHPGAFVHPGAHVIGDVHIGDQASIWPSAVLRGDCGRITIGARTSIQDGAVAHASHDFSVTVVGDECTVGHRVVLHGCRIGNRCLIGMGSVLLDNAELGDFCLLGAGSLVTQDKKFPPYSLILGSPAKRVRDLTEAERQHLEEGFRSYLDLVRRYRG